MKFLWVFGAIFLVVGVGLLSGGVAWWRASAAFAATAAGADGVVADLVYRSSSKGGTYVPLVEFTTPDGARVHMTGSTGSNPAAYARGDHVHVLYDPANPERARIDSFMEQSLGPAILGGLGLVFALIGGGVVGAQIRRRKVRSWLAQNGMRVQARFEGVALDTSYAVNGRNPWRINCQWQHPVTQKVYIFRSDPIWFDPAPYVKRDALDVTVNADDPRQYLVDTSFLPQNG
ncbi:MAG TPA: DUF3592 domain-containing protein [Rudaea sp.]|nr:DUF3592 domain-containing protein [Rudaea sp.]